MTIPVAPSWSLHPHVSLSLRCLACPLTPCPRPLFSVPQTLGSPVRTSRGSLGAPGAQDEGLPPHPHPERGREGAVRLWPVWPEGSVCAVAWSPPAPGTCRAAAAPGLEQSKHSRRQLGYLYRGPGAGPVPTTAPALPSRHSQPRASVAPAGKGTHRRRSLHSAQRPLGVSLGMPVASLGTHHAPPALETPHKIRTCRTPLKTQNTSKIT